MFRGVPEEGGRADRLAAERADPDPSGGLERPLLLLGGAGLLGEALQGALRDAGRCCLAPPRGELDLTDGPELERWLDARRPRAVINAAAYTDVARAELPRNRRRAFLLNRDAPAALARACRRRQLPLIHVSTDFVFDGRATRPYREQDPAAPLQIYGLSKWEGELAVREAHPAALVVRTSTLFGPGRPGRPHYVDAILRQARAGRPLSVVRAPVASPTYTPDLARALVHLLDSGVHGLVHVVNAGGCSRLELARATVRLGSPGGPDPRIRERPADPGGPRRPDYCVLDSSHYASLAGQTLRPWSVALEEYIGGRRP